jgi:protein-disulfide isomerase
VTSVALNRILIVLGFVGLFISGFLSLSHYMELSLPCGAAKGCDTVTSHASAYLTGDHFKGGIPVAYLGLLGYVLLTALAVFKGVKGKEGSKALNLIGFLFSGAGALYSGYLTYTALYVIHATCLWCISSALTMVLTTVAYAALVQADSSQSPTKRGKDVILAGVMTVLLGVSLGGMISWQKARGMSIKGPSVDIINQENEIPIVAEDDHIYGNPDAPVTIVEFADLLCPTCQRSFPVVEDLVKNSNGKIRLVFHHFPLFGLQGHDMAMKSAAIAEVAADESKFWQFLGAIYSKQQADLQTEEAIMAIAASVGLDPKKVQKRLEDPEDPAIKRVTDDLNLGNQIKISATPSIFIQAKGGRFEAVNYQALEQKLNEEPYRSLITGASAGK